MQIIPPPDKAISHRALIIASISQGISKIKNLSESNDVIATLNSLKKLGIKIKKKKNVFYVYGNTFNFNQKQIKLFTNNSASTMRFLSGLLVGLNFKKVILLANKSLNKRPMDRIISPLKEMNANIKSKNIYPPITIKKSNLKGINFYLKIPSAQVKTSILFASLNAKNETIIKEKFKTRTHTEKLLKLFKANIKIKNNIIKIKPSKLKAQNLNIPGDFSSIAPFIILSILKKGFKLKIKDVNLNDGRIGLLKILKRMNANVKYKITKKTFEDIGEINTSYSPNLKNIIIKSEEIPSLIDEIPILSLALSKTKGLSIIKGLKELKIKESDRLNGIKDILTKLKVRVFIKNNNLYIKGTEKLFGGFKHNGFNDHRLIMLLAISNLLTEKRIKILNKNEVNKSFPNFFKELNKFKKPDE